MGKSFSEYMAINAMNASTLVHGLESMRQLRYVQQNGYEPQTDTRFGSALHAMVEMLPIEKFDLLFEIIPDFKDHPGNVTATGAPSDRTTKWVKEQESEYRKTAEDNGAEILNRTEYYRCERMLKSVQNEPTAMRLIDGSEKEVTVEAMFCDVACKGRIDGIKGGTLWDVKSTPNLMRFGRQVANLEYLFRLAFYVQLLEANQVYIQSVKLIGVIDSKQRRSDGKYNHCPDCVVYDVPMIAIENQYSRIEKVMRDYKRCLARGHWPGIAEGREKQLDIPLWSMSEDDGELIGAEQP